MVEDIRGSDSMVGSSVLVPTENQFYAVLGNLKRDVGSGAVICNICSCSGECTSCAACASCLPPKRNEALLMNDDMPRLAENKT